MPVPKQVATGSLIVATVATAAGLNLGVLDIGGTSEAETTAAAPAAEAAAVVIDDQTAASGALPAAAGLEGRRSTGAASALRVAPIVEVSSDSSASAGDAEWPNHDSDHDADHGEDDAHESESHDRDDDETSDHGDSDRDDAEHDDDHDEHRDMGRDVARSSETMAPTTETTASSTTRSTSSTQPATTRTTAAPSTASSAAPVSRTEYKTYQFDGVASIIVAVHDGRRLEFWSASPEDGWAFRVEADRADKVKVKFRPTSGGDEAVFEVKFDDGRLEVKKEY